VVRANLEARNDGVVVSAFLPGPGFAHRPPCSRRPRAVGSLEGGDTQRGSAHVRSTISTAGDARGARGLTSEREPDHPVFADPTPLTQWGNSNLGSG
jgi:hypothetical protein